MNLTTKTTATIDERHFRPEVARIVQVVLEESPPQLYERVTITSGSDSHATGKHVEGCAFDFRISEIKALDPKRAFALAQRWAHRVQARLGADYDVLLHGEVLHLHVEYDPKPGREVGAGFFTRIAALHQGSPAVA